LNLSNKAFQRDIPGEAKLLRERFVRGMGSSVYQGQGHFITVKARPVPLRILPTDRVAIKLE